jgi:hypothetical protein
MRNDTASQQDRRRQPCDVQLGDWYNYEASEITLDAQEFDHWLSKLEDSLSVPVTQSPA